MGRRTRECLLCGTKYNYCPTCSQDKMKPTWMTEFHDENCKNIFDICTRFNMNMMDKEAAQEALRKCDLSNDKNFKSYAQRDIVNIMTEPEAPKPVQTKAPKTAVKTAKSHEVVNKKEENK